MLHSVTLWSWLLYLFLSWIDSLIAVRFRGWGWRGFKLPVGVAERGADP